VRQRIASEVKTVEFVGDRLSYIWIVPKFSGLVPPSTKQLC